MKKLFGVLMIAAMATSAFPAEEPGYPPVIWGTQTRTAAPNGSWRSYWASSRVEPIACDSESIWFYGGWRYNVRERKVDVSGVPSTKWLGHSVDLAEDGRLAMLATGQGVICLWDPQSGWSQVLLPDGAWRNEQQVAFGSDGLLYCFSSRTGGFRLKDGRWEQVEKMPLEPRLSMCRTEGGWMWWRLMNHEKHVLRCVWQSADFSEQVECGDCDDLWPLGPCCYVGGRPYRLFSVRAGKGSGRKWVFGRVQRGSIERLHEQPEHSYYGLDLKSGRDFVMKISPAGIGTVLEDGKEVSRLEPALPRDLGPHREQMFRDANGDYWINNWRWDGKVWQTVLPPRVFVTDYKTRQTHIIEGRLRYDAAAANWVDCRPEVPINVRWYNPKDRTGWILGDNRGMVQLAENKWQHNQPGRYVLAMYRFNVDGSRELLAEFAQGDTPPLFRDARGDWWFKPQRRWDGAKMHDHYESLPDGTTSEIILSPKGRVWRMYSDGRSERFDPSGEKFVAAEPFEEFAFEVGGRRLAILNSHYQDRDIWQRGQVYVQDASGWHALRVPFVTESEGYIKPWLADFFYADRLRAVHEGRMLLSSYHGVFEWDVATDKFSFLAPGFCPWTYFEDGGLRVISDNLRFYIFEGETLSDVESPAAAVHRKAQKGLRERAEQLLRQMDDTSFRLRQEATQAAIDECERRGWAFRNLLATLLEQPEVSPEVEMRLRRVLAATEGLKRLNHDMWLHRVRLAVGNSLLERMSPVIRPHFPDGRRIRLGMPLREATAILAAFGGTDYYFNISPDTDAPVSCVLPNGLKLYIRSEEGTGGELIVTAMVLAETGRIADDRPNAEEWKKLAVEELNLDQHGAVCE